MTDIPIRRALVSVSDKTGIGDLARALSRRGVTLVSTGGTRKHLADQGLPVLDIAEVTGFPEMMDGRLKTLHPKVHGGLLAVRDNTEHVEAMRAHDITAIDLLIVNLYPFEATVAAGKPEADCIENIDIGGPAMLRAAAKNHESVTVVTDPADYAELLSELEANGGATTLGFRKRLAAKTYATTARYDSMISSWMFEQQGEAMPPIATVAGTRVMTMRYGENPHQQAALYQDAGERAEPCRGAAGAGQGALLQQHRRCGRGLRARLRSRSRQARARHHQARKPVRRGDGRESDRGLPAGAENRSGQCLRRHHRHQREARCRDGDRDFARLHRGDRGARGR